MNSINICYPNGHMTVNLDDFFPTLQGNVKKLIKAIDLDYESRNEIIGDIRSWIEKEIRLCDCKTPASVNRKEKLQKNLELIK